jgi:hypothetical protein
MVMVSINKTTSTSQLNQWNTIPRQVSLAEVLHKDEKILGRKRIYLPHAQTAIYDSKVKLFLKQGIFRQLGRGCSI